MLPITSCRARDVALGIVTGVSVHALEVLDFGRDALNLKGEHSVRALCALLGGHQRDRRP